MKKIGQAFAAEGRLAEMENRPNDAANSYQDSIHLGIISAEGGMLIDHLVSMAVESIGREELQKLAPRMNASQCRAAVARFENLDALRTSWKETIEQERNWASGSNPEIRGRLEAFMQRKELKAEEAKARRKFESHQTEFRLLIIDLAARAYKLDKGAPPASVSDLIPEYLTAIPNDPVTGTNLTLVP